VTAIEDRSGPGAGIASATGATGTAGRRTFLAAMAGAGALALASCASDPGGGRTLSLTSALPTAVNPRTELAISIVTTELQLQASGQLSKLPFKVSSWPNLQAGPDIIEGFRAHSIDVANNAGIPPIQAHSSGVQAKIVAVATTNAPTYQFATAPGSDVTSVAEFRGKKLAFSQGQAQGVVLLRALKQAGIPYAAVDLIPMTSDEFLTALEARQVDVAVLAQPVTTEYIDGFGSKGARIIDTSVVDYLSILWSPVEVLEDAAKAAAIRAFIPFWARASVWAWENPAQWIQTYYVGNQHLTTEQGELIVKAQPKPAFPVSWAKAIAWEQETNDLLAAGGFDPKFDVSALFDTRFEGIAPAAVPAQYRE
jgi:sulfonate transport system substrate-binding protein